MSFFVTPKLRPLPLHILLKNINIRHEKLKLRTLFDYFQIIFLSKLMTENYKIVCI